MPPKPSEDFSTTDGDGWGSGTDGGQAPSPKRRMGVRHLCQNRVRQLGATMGSGTFAKIVFFQQPNRCLAPSPKKMLKIHHYSNFPNKNRTEVPDPSVHGRCFIYECNYKRQMSLLYSAIVLSDEKNPALLMLTSAFFAQVLRSS